MAKDIRVKIVGDDSSFQAAIKRANLSAEKTGSSFTTMGKHIAGGLAAFAGVSVGVGLLEESVRAAQNAETAHALLAQQMKNVGLSFKANEPAIARFTESLSKMSGFTGTELTSAFTGLIRVTKNVGKAQDDLRTAVDLARLKHIDLASATSLVTKAQIGMVGGLRRVGIDVHAVTTNVDALRAAHDRAAAAAKAHGATIEKVSKDQLDAAKAADKEATATSALAQLHRASAGAAEAYGKTSAGAMDRFKASVEHLQVELGTKLLPTISRVADKATTFVDDWNKAGTTAHNVNVDFQHLTHTLVLLAQAADKVQDAWHGLSTEFTKLQQGSFTNSLAKWEAGIANLVPGVHVKWQSLTQSLSGKGGVAVPGAMSSSVPGSSGAAGQTGSHGKDQSASIVAAAQSQLGISYQWGGPAILGQHTDCSGLAQAVLAKAGIHVGRTTYEQWTQGKAVVQPQAGDLVFFEMGPKGPQHVGVYIGNDQFIEDPHTGSSVRVSKLSARGDYCGARTYMTQRSGGGKAPTGDTGGSSSSTPTWKTTPKPPPKTSTGAASGFSLPIAIRTALSAAGLTKGTADDLKALEQAKRFIESKLKSLTGEKKIEAMDALQGINDRIGGIEDSAAAKRLAKQKDAQDRARAAAKAGLAQMNAETAAQLKSMDAAWKKHLTVLQAVADAAKTKVANAWADAGKKIMDGFDKATAAGLSKLQKDYAAALSAFDRETQAGLAARSAPDQTPEEKALAAFLDQRAAADQAKSRADQLANAADDSDRAALAAQFALDDQQKALEDAAAQSRKAADDAAKTAQDTYQQQRDALRDHMDGQEQILEDGYQNQRDIEKDNLDKWLAYQQQQLDAGKESWETFFKQVAALASAYGFDFPTGLSGLPGTQSGATGLPKSLVGIVPAGASIAKSVSKSSYDVGGIQVVPGFAAGGPVTKTGLAMVHQGEHVVPKSGALVASGGGDTYHFTFPNYVGSKAELEQLVTTAVVKANRKGTLLSSDLL